MIIPAHTVPNTKNSHPLDAMTGYALEEEFNTKRIKIKDGNTNGPDLATNPSILRDVGMLRPSRT